MRELLGWKRWREGWNGSDRDEWPRERENWREWRSSSPIENEGSKLAHGGKGFGIA